MSLLILIPGRCPGPFSNGGYFGTIDSVALSADQKAIIAKNGTRLLLDAGADPDVRDSDGTTALMRAAYFRNVEAVESLIAAGADIETRDLAGRTALQWLRERRSTAEKDRANESDIEAMLLSAGAGS